MKISKLNLIFLLIFLAFYAGGYAYLNSSEALYHSSCVSILTIGITCERSALLSVLSFICALFAHFLIDGFGMRASRRKTFLRMRAAYLHPILPSPFYSFLYWLLRSVNSPNVIYDA